MVVMASEEYTRGELMNAVYSPEQLEKSVYRFHPPHMCGAFGVGRLFGGQAVSQAFRAIQEHLEQTVIPETIQYKFIGPGKGDSPLDYHVKQLTDNRVTVSTWQNGKHIGSMMCRLSPPDLYPTIPLELDYVGNPEDLPPLAELMQGLFKDNFPINRLVYDMRGVEWARKPIRGVPRTMYWAKLHQDCTDFVPTRCGLQAILFLSDFMILQVAADIYARNGYRMGVGASLHHTVHFHKTEINPHGWYLFRTECDRIANGRALIKGTVYDEKREAVISIIQEGYAEPIRKKPRENAKL